MSGNNRQGNQGGQGGQRGQRGQGGQQPQQGQQQRGQQQGQPPQGQQQGQRGQSPQGGGRPPQQAGGGGGGRDIDIDADVVKNIAIWGISAFVILGLVLGLVPFLYGFAGNANGETQSVSANSTLAQERANEQQVANNVVNNNLASNNASAAAAYDQMQSQNTIIQEILVFSPYLGLVFAGIAALLIGLRSSADEASLAAGMAVAIVVGLTLFIVLSSAVAGFQYNSMSQDDWRNQHNTDPADWNPYPASDFSGNAQQTYLDNYQNQYGKQPTRGLTSAASVSSIRTIRGMNINYGTIFINALLFGVVTALGGAGIAVGSKRLSEIIE